MSSTYSTYLFGAVTSLKFLAIENMPQITAQLRIVDYSNALRAAVVAILPDNCHPCSWKYIQNAESIEKIYK